MVNDLLLVLVGCEEIRGEFEGFVEPFAGRVGKCGSGQGVVKVNGLAQSVNDNAAIFATGHVLFYFSADSLRGRAIHII